MRLCYQFVSLCATIQNCNGSVMQLPAACDGTSPGVLGWNARPECGRRGAALRGVRVCCAQQRGAVVLAVTCLVTVNCTPLASVMVREMSSAALTTVAVYEVPVPEGLPLLSSQ